MKNQSLMLSSLFCLLLPVFPAECAEKDRGNTFAPVSGPTAGEIHELSVGNSNIYWLLDAWGSPLVPPYWPNDDWLKRELGFRELDALLTRAADVKADYIEDYVGWGVVEPQPGQWQWDIYQDSALRIKNAGYRYIPYVWIQNLPSWARSNESFPRAVCLEHLEQSESLSIFSTATRGIYDRVFSNLKGAMGAMIDMVRIGAPHDFGESTYPAGLAARAFPMRHEHDGFWAAESEAQLHFRRAMAGKYKMIEALNAAWNTEFPSLETVMPPSDNAGKRFWLDFVNWYHDALTEKMGEFIDVAKQYFGAVQFNLGAPNERITLGQDISGLAELASQKQAYLRAPGGPFVPHLMLKRNSTAVKHYGVRQFSLEVHDNSLRRREIARYLFDCLTTGLTWNFEYPENMQRAEGAYRQYKSLWRGGRSYPEVDTALFFSTTAHRLNVSRDSGGSFFGYSEGLVPFTESLRDAMDFDVVDERLILEDALSRYRILGWCYGGTTEAAAVAKIREWVQNGGILAVDDLAQIRTVEGETGAFSDLVEQSTGPSVHQFGRGYVYDGKRNPWEMMAFISNGVRLSSRGRRVQGLLPPLDNAQDGVLMSLFADGILLFNSRAETVTKGLWHPSGSWSVSYRNLPTHVELAPYAIRWIDGASGEVRTSYRQ